MLLNVRDKIYTNVSSNLYPDRKAIHIFKMPQPPVIGNQVNGVKSDLGLNLVLLT